MRNVSRAWAYETGLAAGVELGEGAHLHSVARAYAQDEFCRDPSERVLRVLWARLQARRQVFQHGRPQLGTLPRPRAGHCFGEPAHVGWATERADARYFLRATLPACPSTNATNGEDIPRTALDAEMDDPNADEDLIPRDARRVTRLLDSVIQHDGELSDSDDEGEGGRRDIASHRDDDTEREESEEKGAPRVVAHTTKVPMGIMNSGSTQGAGPSASSHPTMEVVATAMDVDEPSS